MKVSKHLPKKFLLFLAFTLLILPFGQIAAAAGSYQVASVPAEAIGKDPAAGHDIVPGQILVKYKNGTTSPISGFSIQSVTSVNSLGVKKIVLGKDEDVYAVIAKLSEDPNVEYAEPVYRYSISGNVHTSGQSVVQSVYDPNDTYYQSGDQWGLAAMNMPYAWDKVSVAERANVTVAVVDTGVRATHEDLAGKVLPGYDFVGVGDNDPDDDFGHGTHVAGIVAAISDNSKGIAGVAGGVNILPVKVMDSNGIGDSIDIAEGILYAADNGADIINLSLGSPDAAIVIEDAVNYALSKGIVVVAATGNESSHYSSGVEAPVSYPAAYDGVIGVGAVDYDQVNDEFFIADFSNIGPEVDVVAPGVDILSTYYDAINPYTLNSGTSMATPMVSGLAALILAADSGLRQTNNYKEFEEVQRILEESALDLGAPGWDPYYGYGLVQGDMAFIDKIRMDWSADAQGQLTFDLSIHDYNGTVVDAVYDNITMSVGRLNFVDFYPTTWEDLGSSTVTKDVYGDRTVTYNLTEPGYYSFTADDDGNSNLVYSQIILVNTPEAPTASLASGSYEGTQTVTLTSASSGATIYYTLNGDNPDTSSSQYSSPISISANTTLKAIAYKNGVVSGISEFTYTITYPTSSYYGGGAVYLPVQNEIEKTPETSDDGSLKLNVNVPEDYLSDKLNSDEKEVEIDATSDQKSDLVAIQLPVSSLRKAGESGKILIVKTNDVVVELPPGFLPNEGQGSTVQLKISKVKDSKADTGSTLVSPVFDFELLNGDQSIHQFNGKITITLNYDAASVSDPGKLGVYYFNEAASTWEYVGGKITEEGKIIFATAHFSKYAVLEFQSGFTDIAGHWAERDIELMSAKHIAKGLTDTTFAPSRHITRAEFAAWIVRALDLPEVKTSASFADVKADAWYNDAVYRAYGAGIIKGNSETTFGPSVFITRQEMAVMLMNAYAYATGKKLDDMFITAEVKFADEGSASQWARRYVRLASATGLMTGNPDGMFVPKGQATRAEAISVIKRLLDQLNK